MHSVSYQNCINVVLSGEFGNKASGEVVATENILYATVQNATCYSTDIVSFSSLVVLVTL